MEIREAIELLQTLPPDGEFVIEHKCQAKEAEEGGEFSVSDGGCDIQGGYCEYITNLAKVDLYRIDAVSTFRSKMYLSKNDMIEFLNFLKSNDAFHELERYFSDWESEVLKRLFDEGGSAESWFDELLDSEIIKYDGEYFIHDIYQYNQKITNKEAIEILQTLPPDDELDIFSRCSMGLDVIDKFEHPLFDGYLVGSYNEEIIDTLELSDVFFIRMDDNSMSLPKDDMIDLLNFLNTEWKERPYADRYKEETFLLDNWMLENETTESWFDRLLDLGIITADGTRLLGY